MQNKEKFNYDILDKVANSGGLWEAVHKERAEKERTEKEKTGMA